MNITLTREEAQQVLDALRGDSIHAAKQAIETLRARLSAPEPEPVAWMNEGDIGKTDWKVWAHGKPTATIPLYTAPPQRKDIYEEGCTPADFRVLREANARMAQELFELRSKK
jgi:hypothetical protein